MREAEHFGALFSAINCFFINEMAQDKMFLFLNEFGRKHDGYQYLQRMILTHEGSLKIREDLMLGNCFKLMRSLLEMSPEETTKTSEIINFDIVQVFLDVFWRSKNIDVTTAALHYITEILEANQSLLGALVDQNKFEEKVIFKLINILQRSNPRIEVDVSFIGLKELSDQVRILFISRKCSYMGLGLRIWGK